MEIFFLATFANTQRLSSLGPTLTNVALRLTGITWPERSFLFRGTCVFLGGLQPGDHPRAKRVTLTVPEIAVGKVGKGIRPLASCSWFGRRADVPSPLTWERGVWPQLHFLWVQRLNMASLVSSIKNSARHYGKHLRSLRDKEALSKHLFLLVNAAQGCYLAHCSCRESVGYYECWSLLVESPEIVQYSGPDAAAFYFLNQKLLLRSTENKERGEFQETLRPQVLAVPAFFKRS